MAQVTTDTTVTVTATMALLANPRTKSAPCRAVLQFCRFHAWGSSFGGCAKISSRGLKDDRIIQANGRAMAMPPTRSTMWSGIFVQRNGGRLSACFSCSAASRAWAWISAAMVIRCSAPTSSVRAAAGR